jgi:protein-S-isoprenylcysteine O-methyltransferase Ste14
MNEPPDIPGVITWPPLIALAGLLLGLALDWLLPTFILRGVFDFWTRLMVGGILIGTGSAMSLVAWRSFVQAGTNAVPWKPSLTLVMGGIFGWMRNPMYVGLMLSLVGLAIALASDWTLILAVPTAVILHFGVVKREERYLKAKFGATYDAYMNKVPRYGWPAV